ncbi:MAG: helix-turn-helix transcriptional regulator [Spirochaetes bacterium]|nr:helix-turn-helix transcriptional regulator [Spirochaetota bacterium]
MFNSDNNDDFDIKIFSYDLTYNSDRWREFKFFKEYSIWYMLAGSIKIKMDDRKFTAKAGDVILIYPKKLFSSVPVTKNFFLRSIHFDVFYEYNLNLFEMNDMCGLYPGNYFKKETEVLKDIFIDKKKDKSLSRVVLKGYILIILDKIINYYNRYKTDDVFLSRNYDNKLSKLQKVYEYIYGNIEKSITVDELANLVNLSKNYFCNFIKKVTGTSAQCIIYRAKMIKAKEYLRINQYPVKTISYILGYKDQNAFSRAFKRYHKISPSKFI